MSDVYKIAVEIALAGTIVQGLEAISAKMLGINSKVKDIEGGMRRWALGIGGVASIMGGHAIFKGMEKAVEAGGELVKQQTLLRNMGVSQADVLVTTARAQQAVHEVIGTTISENIKGMRELMGVMPSLHEAQEKFVSIMRGAKVLESLTGTPAEKTLQTLAKAVELRGGGVNPTTHELDPERLDKEVQAAVRAIIASGGLVDQRQLLNLMQQAGPMARSVENADAFYKGILTAVMDMGGFRAGTALTAVGRQLLGGKMTKPTAEEMERLGLLRPGGWHKSGTGVYVEPGALRGEDILKDPEKGAFDWFNKVLIPAFSEHGITKNADIQQELYRAFGTETARRLAGLFVQNKAQVLRDAQLYDQALGGQAYENIAKGDYAANVKNLHTAWENFLQSFGAPMVPVAISALQKLSSVMNSIADFAGAHPEAMKIIGEALIGLAAGLTALGVTAVLAAAAALIPGGAIAAAIIGIGAAIAVLAAMNWSDVTKWVTDIGTHVVSAFASLPGLVAGAIESAIAGIAAKFVGALQHFLNQDAPIGDPGGGFGPIPQNFRGNGPDRSLMQRTDWRPPGKTQQPINIPIKLDIDGRTLAEAISGKLAELFEFPTQAPYFDGKSAWAPPDMQFAST